ncbi:MAG: lysozyme [Pacificimonas sp.]|jgi:lysozyme|nr:lysozyme [Pacificimonas sp.]
MAKLKRTTLAAGATLTGAALAIAVPLIGKWEGKSNDPYRDIVGVQTVCYGETRVEMRSHTDAECTAMLVAAVEEFQDRVLACTPSLAGRPHQLAAATSLAYNVGWPSYCRSTADRRFDAGDYAGGCRAITWWNRAGGRKVRGLVNRREDEYRICMEGL